MIKILIVDDAAFMRMSLTKIFTEAGYEVIGEAQNGIEGVEKYIKLQPDVVTLDISMPEMDGITALKEIRKTDPNAVCIMCSSAGQQSMVIEAIEAGASDFVTKPFIADRVAETVRGALHGGKDGKNSNY